MADEVILISPNGTVAAEVETTAPKKAPRQRKATSEASRAAALKQAKPKNRRLSTQEKLQKVDEIEAQIAGGATLKDAVKSMGISDQTYYQWKKATASDGETKALSVSVDDELAEFIQLEEENRRLRKLLSDKLRAENADLRKRLGMR